MYFVSSPPEKCPGAMEISMWRIGLIPEGIMAIAPYV
jgi:hypothetical protein